jgi:hypothetical protein
MQNDDADAVAPNYVDQQAFLCRYLPFDPPCVRAVTVLLGMGQLSHITSVVKSGQSSDASEGLYRLLRGQRNALEPASSQMHRSKLVRIKGGTPHPFADCLIRSKNTHYG